MKRTIFLCAIIMVFLPLWSQNQIKGRITDKGWSALAGATVWLPDLNKGTVSDSEGYYDLNGLPSGKVRIQFSYIGFSNQIVTLVLEKPDNELNISLETSTIKTEEIVISSGYSSTQHENAVKIEALKLDYQEIKPTPNFTEIITRVPGVEMISKGSGVSKPVIRGLSMNDILVLNNGVRFENYQYSDHHPLGIDEFGIDDIEVIKGPSSLLYGSDAIGGVINFIRERPAPVGTIAGDYNLQMFSNTLGITNNLGIKGSSGKFFAGIRFGQKSNADFLQGGGEFVPNTRFSNYSLKLSTGITGKRGTTKIYYDYGRQNLGLAEEEAIESVTERKRRNKVYYQQFNTNLLSVQNKFYLGKMKLDLNAAYQNTELIHFGETDAVEIRMRLATLTYESKLYLPSDQNSEYIVGYHGMYQDNLNHSSGETILLPDAYIFNNSFFFLVQKNIRTKLKFQAGLRYDNRKIETIETGIAGESGYRPQLDKHYNSVSGSAGATVSFSKYLLVRANIASAYRTPNLAELTSNGRHETRFEKGDENLVPEKSYEADMSLHYHIDNLTIDLAVFNNKIYNHIFIAPTGDSSSSGIPIYRYEQNTSTLYGTEAGIHYHPESLKWLHFLTTFSSVTGKSEDGNWLPFIPAKKICFEFRAEKKHLKPFYNAYIMTSSALVFSQHRTAPEEAITKGYGLIDISVGGNIKIKDQFAEIALGCTNIFDKKYIDHLSTLKEVNYFNPGRNFTLTLKIPFSIRTAKLKGTDSGI